MRFYIPAIILIVATLVYLSIRTARLFAIPVAVAIVIFVVLYAFAIGVLSSSLYMNGLKGYQHYMVMIGCSISGFLITLLFTMMVCDVIGLAVHMPGWCQGLATYFMAVGITLYACYVAKNPTIRNVPVTIEKVEQPLRIAQLTDLHIGHFRGYEWLDDVVEKVNAEHPDMVVITGDIFESHYNFSEQTVLPLQKLQMPVLFVEGNHDIYVNQLKTKSLLRDIGVRVLENEKIDILGVQVIGLNYMRADSASHDAMHVAKGDVTIENVLPTFGIDTTRPSILLHHNPKGVGYASANGVDLYLAGHTHGGQFFPVTLINHFIFNYNNGLYRFGNTQVYTSPGLGTTAIPLRFGTHPEITIIDITK